MMTRSFLTVSLAALLLASCKNNDNDDIITVKPYTVPTTYSFANASYSVSANRSLMAEELRAYLNTAHQTPATITPLDAAKINNMWNNTGSPFANAALNTSGLSIKTISSNPELIKKFVDSIVIYNTNTPATQGTGGFLLRNSGKIIVGPRGLEYIQGYAKGYMSTAFFKEAVRLLTEVKSVSAADTAKAQKIWDEAYGNLSVPNDYDTSKSYASSDPNRPLFWGGYLKERGVPIKAGGIIFGAFLKGRAAIGGYDTKVRNEQADIIIAKWEQLAARAGLVYVNMPTLSNNIGNLAAQFHALSEGYGFLMALEHRPAGSKLTAANYAIIKAVMAKDFYVLINQPGFTDLVTVKNILMDTYDIEP